MAGALLSVAAASIVGAQTPARPAIEDLLARAGAYVTMFETRFSGVVAEERYIQVLLPQTLQSRWITDVRHRELKSDFLLVKVPGDAWWLPFRDVFEIDGKEVRDRQDRLTKLFLDPPATAVEQASQIVAESARYNIGRVDRNINVPVFALAVLRPINQPRFRFSHLEEDRKAGPNAWSIEFHETSIPTLIHGTKDADRPAHGRVWIDAPTGAVFRTELHVDDGELRATITTDYRFDPSFGLHMPAEMRERYDQPRYPPISGTASYSHFRRFEVKTEETIKKE